MYMKTKHRLYSTWKSMKNRCTNKNCSNYPRYGGRGISICPSWEFSCDTFVEDMYESFEEGLSLDRVDNNGNYCKENCRWATPKEQANNQNRVYTNIVYKNKSYTEAELSRESGISRTTIQRRRVAGYNDLELVEGRDSRKYLVDGVKFNQRELADFLGLSAQNLNQHLKRGKTLEALVDEYRRL